MDEEDFEGHGDKSGCLIGECDCPGDQEAILQESAATILDGEVSEWHLDSDQHPGFNEFVLCHPWFEIEYFATASDALDEPLVEGD